MAKMAVQQQIGEFTGFPKKTLKFLAELEKHNNTGWFEAHRADYMQYYVMPAQAFVVAMGQRLSKISRHIGADPDYNGKGSIKKIFTDRRFNPERLPYKSWLAIMFWEGPFAVKKENSAFYLRLTARELFLVAGIGYFNAAAQKAYRSAVADPKQGDQLARAIAKATAVSNVVLHGANLKQVPRGCDPGYKHADLLRHDELIVVRREEVPAVLHTPELLDYAYGVFRDLSPVHKWLVGMLKGATS